MLCLFLFSFCSCIDCYNCSPNKLLNLTPFSSHGRLLFLIAQALREPSIEWQQFLILIPSLFPWVLAGNGYSQKRWNHSQINYQAQWPSQVLCDLSISLTITFTFPFCLNFFGHWQGSSYDKRREIRDQVLICETHIWIRSEAAGRSGWRESWLELTWQLISDSMHPHPTA